MKTIVFLLVILTFSSALNLTSSGQITDLFKKALNNVIKKHEVTQLGQLSEVILQGAMSDQRSTSSFRQTIDCIVCRSAFYALFDSVANGQTDSQLSTTISFFCNVLGIEDQHVCDGAIKLNLPIIYYIIQNTPAATPEAFCGMILLNSNNPDACPFNDSRFEWHVDLPEKTEVPVTLVERSTVPLKIAIITDAHIDPLYEPNSPANCGEPTCCRAGQTVSNKKYYQARALDQHSYEETARALPETVTNLEGELVLDLTVVKNLYEHRIASLRINKTQSELVSSEEQNNKDVRSNIEPAGYWGDYRNCDTPLWAYDDTIERISEDHNNIEVIYYIGDTIDHGVWETSYELIKDMNAYVVNKLRKEFGDHVLVVPTIGNHESQPTNQFAPSYVQEPGLNTTWLYEALAEKWDIYLPEEAKQTLRDRGDFSVVVRPGLRAISLNNNVAYPFNWWLVFDPLDQKRHMDWLVSELHKAELAGEKVHILTHIPPGTHDLTYTWSREYNRVVNRFADTIAAEFNGHTHADEFKIFYNDQEQPVSVAWGAGGVNTYSNYNLNYKIVTADPDTLEPTSIETYVYNLTEANLTPNKRPHWFQLYNMKNTFNLNDFSPTSMDNLVKRMVSEERYLLDMYAAFFSKLNDYRWRYCNEVCKLDTLCKVVTTVLYERERCNNLVNMYNLYH